MLKTGKEHLESLRDGRSIYVGRELINDVTTHPYFRQAAKTVANIYDVKRDPKNLAITSCEENGERYSTHWHRPQSQADLRKRTKHHKIIADSTFGFFGRSPDHVAGLITGLATKPEVLDRAGPNYRENLLREWNRMKREDTYIVYAVIPPAGVRHKDIHQEEMRADPGLRVVSEDAEGVVITGMKMLATGAVFSNEILIGNLIPLDPQFSKYALTCVVPCNAPGLKLWVRQPYARNVDAQLDYPMSYQFDETDCVVVCDNVKIPWDKVIIHNDADLSRNCYLMTPANCYANHQSNVRFWSKMSMLVGLASRICQSTGNDKIPGVRDVLGKLVSYEANIAAFVHGQIEGFEPEWPGRGYVCYNRRYMYAALNWCQENHSQIIDIIRELAAGNLMQMPADSTVLEDPILRKQFEDYYPTPFLEAIPRMKLLKFAWDIVGSEFAGRHQLYEKFYAGTSALVRNSSFREAPWESFHATIDKALAELPVPEVASGPGQAKRPKAAAG